MQTSCQPGVVGSLGVSLYTLPNIQTIRESFNRTVENAKLKGVPSVTPWISLGAAYRPTFCKHDCPSPDFYDMEWNYDLAYSWAFGAEINDPWYTARPERFAEWGLAKQVAFFPSVFDLRDTTKMKNPRGALDNTSVPAVMQHFVAHVQGAAGIVPGKSDQFASEYAVMLRNLVC